MQMMEMIKNEYLTYLLEISTDIVQMHMDPEFWYQQHTLDRDAHHLNHHMIDMVRKNIRGDATQMETYIDLGSLVYEYKHCLKLLLSMKERANGYKFKSCDKETASDEVNAQTERGHQVPFSTEQAHLDMTRLLSQMNSLK